MDFLIDGGDHLAHARYPHEGLAYAYRFCYSADRPAPCAASTSATVAPLALPAFAAAPTPSLLVLSPFLRTAHASNQQSQRKQRKTQPYDKPIAVKRTGFAAPANIEHVLGGCRHPPQHFLSPAARQKESCEQRSPQPRDCLLPAKIQQMTHR